MTSSASTAAPAASARDRPQRARAIAADARAALRVRLALALCLTGMAVALALVLAGSPTTVAATNGVPIRGTVASLGGGQAFCEPGAAVPRGTEAVRISLGANAGPAVGVEIRSGATVVSAGSRGAGWGVAESVTVPVRRVSRTVEDAGICISLGAAVEPIAADGERVATSATHSAARLRIEYLRPGSSSWLSLASSIARHMGIGHAPSGTWVAYLVIATMLAVSLIASRSLLREVRPGPAQHTLGAPDGRAPTPTRRLWGVPRGAWICGLIAMLNAACWSLITPPFQVPDEPAHFAYVQLLAETGRLPTSNAGFISPEERAAMRDLRQIEVEWHPETHTISTPAQQRRLEGDLSAHPSRVGPGDAGVAASEPPGYYALETLPYYLGSSGTLLDRLELMRLLSALMTGLTGLFTFLFVRESLPGVPWAWAVGGVAAALTPLLGFSSAAVNPDAMLCAVCAALFYCLARAFRRGLTRRLAFALGGLIAAGLLTKLSFIGVAPGGALGLLALARRRTLAQGDDGRTGARRAKRASRLLAIALALALSPALIYVASNLVEHHHTLGIVSQALVDLNRGSIAGASSYIWQFYLPRLPGMFDYFPGLSTTRQLWFDRDVGLYGWLDTPFPAWVSELALVPAGTMALLALRAIVVRRGALRRRLPELAVYGAMVVGLMILIATISYTARSTEGASYLQGRYLLPLIPLAGALLALAARGAGRRWGPAAGVLIVVLLLAHDVFSQLQVVARYYG